MRRYLIHAYALLGALLTAACIDKYDADLPDSDGNLLVVEGTIRSDELCTFYLSRSTELKDSRYSFELYVSQANISVQGDDGQVFNGSVLSGGSYRIPVGHLSPDHHYWLRIETDGLVFTSEPQAPLYSDPIDTLTFRQDPSDLEVDVMLTSVAPSDGTTKYYRWDFDEYWEVITPYIAQYEYFPPSDALISGREDPGYIAEATPPKYHGWAHRQDRACVLGCTDDFIDGRIFNTLLYSIPSTDDRLSNLYCTRVRQRNISKQEYEYEMLRRKLSSEMGGLFTPMPSELPTNIRCENGDRGVIGYVGVSGEGSESAMFISNLDVSYHNTHHPRDIDPESIEDWSPLQCYWQGYRIHFYDQMIGERSITWTYRWCVDCTDPLWGASLSRPSFWPVK